MLLLSIFAWLSSSAIAPPVIACETSAYRELDYLRGRWQSVWLAKNLEVGRYTIEPAADGCALLMKWTGAPNTPGNGTGLLAYDAALTKWHYVYVAEDATVSLLDGQSDGATIAFEGTKNDPKAPQRKLTVRLTFKKGDGGTVAETWQVSPDSGKTWRPYGQFRLSRMD